MTYKFDSCDGCGAKEHTHEIDGNELCDDCKNFYDIITQNPDRLKNLCHLAKINFAPDTTSAKDTTRSQYSGLPDVLDAVRFRTRDRDLNTWYVSVSEIEGQPVEVFASTAFDSDQHLQSRISNLTTITRLISLVLRHIFLGEPLTLEKTLKQIHRSSRQRNDLPDMLAKVLSKYCEKPQNFTSPS